MPASLLGLVKLFLKPCILSFANIVAVLFLLTKITQLLLTFLQRKHDFITTVFEVLSIALNLTVLMLFHVIKLLSLIIEVFDSCL